jgi:hypothetical protein
MKTQEELINEIVSKIDDMNTIIRRSGEGSPSGNNAILAMSNLYIALAYLLK